MPPKVAAPEQPPEPKNLRISIDVTFEGPECGDKYYVRIFSEWLDCCTSSEVLGSTDRAWEAITDPESNEILRLKSSFTYEYDCNLNSSEAKNNFHTKPGLYAVLIRKDITAPLIGGEAIVSPRATTPLPCTFAFLDCSMLALESTTLVGRSDLFNNIRITVTIENIKPLIGIDDIIHLEPVVLNIERLLRYPCHDQHFVNDTVDNMYIFAKVDLGGGQSRDIIFRPQFNNSTMPSSSTGMESFGNTFDVRNSDGDESDSDREDLDATNATIGETMKAKSKNIFDVDFKVCILPGLTDVSNYKDLISSSTYVLEIHKEDLWKRIFHERNVEEYNRLWLLENPASGDAIGAAAAAPAAKGKAPPPKKAAEPVEMKAPVGPATDSDRFMIQAIWKALNASRLIRPHGAARYRLEQLLASSNDLLVEFGRLRVGVQDGDDNVVVKEDMKLDVRLEKPAKPLRWAMPSDISLRAVLEKEMKDSQSKLDGTMAVGDQTFADLNGKTDKGGRVRSTSKQRPIHEQFIDCSTAILMSAELHRKLVHPKPPPSVLPAKLPLNRVVLGNTVASSSLFQTSRLPTAAENSDENPDQQQQQLPEEVHIALSPRISSDDELAKRLKTTPFARMIFVMRYDNDEALVAVNNAMTTINARALPDIQGSIRSYSFSDEEMTRCVTGSLDVVTGFTIIDDEMRIIVIEGLAGPGQGMQAVFMEIPRVKANDSALKMLCNPEVLFPTRLYGEFGPDLKRIRVREKLKKLARRPELYNRKQVDEVCFAAIDGAMALRRAVDLRSTKDLDMYPSAESINTLEILYGEAISRSDLDGLAAEAERVAQLRKKKSLLKEAEKADSNNNNNNQTSATVDILNNLVGTTRKPRERKVAETDSHNPEFEKYLKSRPVHRVDFLAEQKEQRKIAWESMLRRTQHRETESQAILTRLGSNSSSGGGNDSKIYIYSSQSLNFKNRAYTEMRERLTSVSNASFSYSKEYVSQTISLTVPADDGGRGKVTAEKRKHWLTPTGFQYPKPKTIKDLMTHDKRPTDARIDDLKDPWTGDLPKHMIGAGEGDVIDTELLTREKGYVTQTKSINLFGALKPPGFERPFELKLVGDRSKLPRGIMVVGEDPDPQAFRSIHLGGAGQQKILDEAMAKEKADWLAKVKVDTLAIQIGGFKIRDKPLQMDKTSDILKDEPKRLALKKLREMKSSKGRDLSYQTTALSILSKEPYLDNPSAKLLARTTDASKFITTKELRRSTNAAPASVTSEGEGFGKDKGRSSRALVGDDFSLYIHRGANDSKATQAISKHLHPALASDSVERSGPKWESCNNK